MARVVAAGSIHPRLAMTAVAVQEKRFSDLPPEEQEREAKRRPLRYLPARPELRSAWPDRSPREPQPRAGDS